MLPDFCKLKSDISARLRRFLESRMLHHLGPFSESPRVTFFEGQGRTLTRESGHQESIDPFDLSATMIFRTDEIPSMTLEDLLRKLDEVAKEMAGQMARHTYDTVSEAAKRVGNAVDAKQRVISAEMILDGLSKMHIEFDLQGRPHMPSIHCHPDLLRAVKLASEELERDPSLRKQMKELLILKREEWRVREASRRLVG